MVGSYPGPRCAKTLAANGTEYVRFKAKRCSGNINIQPGAYFDIDLAKPPFSMLPEATYPEGLPDGKTLYLYPMATVRRRVEEFGVSAPEK